jgi:lipid A ethanolaminephosphotransferase
VLLKRPFYPEVATFALAAYVLAFLNVAFWKQLYAGVAPQNAYEWLFLGAVAIEGLCFLNLFFGLFAVRSVFKIAATVILLATAVAAYFADEYGVLIDSHMIRNVFETNQAEAADLLTPKLFLYLLGLGILPAWFLWRSTINYRPFWEDLRFKVLAAAAIFGIVIAAALPFTKNFTSVFREHRALLHTFAPLNYLHALAVYVRKQSTVKAAIVVPFGEDAHKADTWKGRHRKSITVIVIGETARAQNFSLNGYPRATNPFLSKVPDLVNFTRTFSCGTDTAQSVPCMFSGLGRRKYTYERAVQREGLLDILQRVGFSVLWRENQSGCKGVCSRVPTEFVTTLEHRRFYELGNSFDENLLDGLEAKIDGLQGDAVIALHMMGSHGPAYYKRYPDAFEHFKPACKESQFSRCVLAEIVNSYDNSLVYSDYILFRLIELLQAYDSKDVAAAMIYVSDHGESLGEGNLYLHGLPYALAPEEQKRVPMVVWLSPKFQTDSRVDLACLQRQSTDETSHDNLFHSVLGLLDVRTKVYDRGLDIFARCRGAAPTVTDVRRP